MAEKRTIAKAKEIFENNGVEKINDNLFRVKSGTSKRSYLVKENKCNCMGYNWATPRQFGPGNVERINYKSIRWASPERDVSKTYTWGDEPWGNDTNSL